MAPGTPNRGPTMAGSAGATAKAAGIFRRAGQRTRGSGGGGGDDGGVAGGGGGGGGDGVPSTRMGANTRDASMLERFDNTIAVGVGRTENDLEGDGGGGAVVREQFVKVRTPSQGKAMGNMDRKLAQLHNAFQSVIINTGVHDLEGIDEHAGGEESERVGNAAAAQAGGTPPSPDSPASASVELSPCGGGVAHSARAGDVQYRLESRKTVTKGWRRFFCAQQVGGDHMSSFLSHTSCCDINKWINRYLHWTFRTSFAVLLFSMIMGFVVMTLLYAGLIMWSGANNPQCIAAESFTAYGDFTQRDRFADAYQLSWTTFSTVGYGLIYPQTSAGNAEQRDCTGIKILCSSEAFFGVLFSGLCGAILFGKVSRIQSFAQVVFSDPIVVRFGSGIARDGDEDDDDEEDAPSEQAKGDVEEGAKAASGEGVTRAPPKQIPCPILEFRIANRLNNTPGGEIMDATLNCVASIDARHACPDILKTVDTHARGGGKNSLRRRKKHAGGTSSGRSSDEKESLNDNNVRSSGIRSSVVASAGALRGIAEGTPLAQVTPKSSAGSLAASADAHGDIDPDLEALAGSVLLRPASSHQAMEEDSSNLAPRRIFSKMEIETYSHPFFKRVWLARHVLNEHSPLLTSKAKRMIRKNKGHWPEELSNYAAMRKSIRFNQILVSLSGTCNVNGASVYAQKIYHYVDIVVGYKFANALFRDRDTGSLRVDLNLVNDVQEQDGSDEAEPLEGVAIGEDDS